MRFTSVLAGVLLIVPVMGQAQPMPNGLLQPGEYSNEADARRGCAGDTVVWANTATHVLHARGDQYYGKTKNGAYVCQAAAMRAGMRMDKKN